MANGSWLSQAEWHRAEAALLALDPVLDAFADRHRLQVTRNARDWPERSIVWGDRIRRLIHVYLVDRDQLTYTVWLCASQDRIDGRFWKHESPVHALPASAFADSLASILADGKLRLDSWSESDLTFATPLTPFPGGDRGRG